ncbi:hypothetical protein KCP71_22625 [Salmonella enterica subsp. enterica]|nr:hypothetical protein KCP71_22625 [Salmonella enterica subsp. enterica]
MKTRACRRRRVVADMKGRGRALRWSVGRGWGASRCQPTISRARRAPIRLVFNEKIWRSGPRRDVQIWTY